MQPKPQFLEILGQEAKAQLGPQHVAGCTSGKNKVKNSVSYLTFLKEYGHTLQDPEKNLTVEEGIWRFLHRAWDSMLIYRIRCSVKDDEICMFKIFWRTLHSLRHPGSSWSTGRCFFLTFWICMLDKYKPYLFTSRSCDTRTLQVQEWIELHIKGSR